MTKSAIEPEYKQIHEPLEGVAFLRHSLNLSTGRPNILVARDLIGLVRDLYIVAHKITSQVDATSIDVRGIDRRLEDIDDRFHGIIHSLGESLGLSQEELNKIIQKFENVNKENYSAEFLSINKMINEMDILRPENEETKSSFKGKINYSKLFRKTLEAYSTFTQLKVLLPIPEFTSSLFRREHGERLTPGEFFILGIGSKCLPQIKTCLHGVKVFQSSNLRKIEEITCSLENKINGQIRQTPEKV